jgi:hypothetical protein
VNWIAPWGSQRRREGAKPHPCRRTGFQPVSNFSKRPLRARARARRRVTERGSAEQNMEPGWKPVLRHSACARPKCQLRGSGQAEWFLRASEVRPAGQAPGWMSGAPGQKTDGLWPPAKARHPSTQPLD